MSKRIAILLLALITAFAGLSICPRGVRACSISPGAARKCCGQAGALQKPSCCKSAAKAAPTTVAGRIDQLTNVALWPALSGSTVSTSPVAQTRPIACVSDDSLAPPGTLLTQHTSLLL